MSDEKLRLGGMALANGVLVHGPTAWACAIRNEDGELKVVAKRKRLRASNVESPLLRGPVRLLDAMAIIPQIRRALPEAKLPFQRPAVLATRSTCARVWTSASSSPVAGRAASRTSPRVSSTRSSRACRRSARSG